jgi:hypothetical protein
VGRHHSLAPHRTVRGGADAAGLLCKLHQMCCPDFRHQDLLGQPFSLSVFHRRTAATRVYLASVNGSLSANFRASSSVAAVNMPRSLHPPLKGY